MNTHFHSISPNAERAAAMWGKGGRDYDLISFAISDALAHAAQRLHPRRGEHILDLATGTGWSARNIARFRAEVTGVDISSELLEAARELCQHVKPPVIFERADVTSLPFPDSSFDGAISTFGIMFAPDQPGAARELARVCKPGARIVIAAWKPGGSVEEFFGIIGRYNSAPPDGPSPLAWGECECVRRLLGESFDLVFEDGTSHAYHDSVDGIWDWYAKGFGPVRQLVETLDDRAHQRFRKDVDAYHSSYQTEAGLSITRDYLLTIGQKRKS